MTVTADCINTHSTGGRNATPLPIIRAVKATLGGIELDCASDAVINASVGAERYFSIENNGFVQSWATKTAFLNAPGTTVTGGLAEQRIEWVKHQQDKGYVKPAELKVIKASEWYWRLYEYWRSGLIDHAIALVYRGGSVGSLGEILSQPTCATAANASSEVVNGSGRISYELITEAGDRLPQTTNTQSSLFFLLTRSDEVRGRFVENFEQFGVVKL
ncbi:MAG: hypothetical protein AAFX78_10150 [Cyanobacteria bacterium J06638_20]